MLDNEIKEQRVLGTVLPSIFLGVAAFLLNVVVSRLVATQREQIAALKALGYPNRTHRRALPEAGAADRAASAWCSASRSATGWARMFTGLYAEFFHFPSFEHRIAPWLLLVSVGITLATAVLGTLNAIAGHGAAGAGRGDAPAGAGPLPAHAARAAGHRRASGPALRMILRNMERRPLRTALSIGGVAAAVAIVVMGNFFRDAIDVHRRLAVQPGDAQRRRPCG